MERLLEHTVAWELCLHAGRLRHNSLIIHTWLLEWKPPGWLHFVCGRLRGIPWVFQCCATLRAGLFSMEFFIYWFPKRVSQWACSSYKTFLLQFFIGKCNSPTWFSHLSLITLLLRWVAVTICPQSPSKALEISFWWPFPCFAGDVINTSLIREINLQRGMIN